MLTTSWTQTLSAFGSAVGLAVVIGLASGLIIRRLARYGAGTQLRRLHHHCHLPWQATLLAFALRAAVPGAALHPGSRTVTEHVLVVACIAAVSWLVAKVLFVLEDAALEHVRTDITDNRRARKMRTQLTTLRRLTALVIGVVAAAAILMTFAGLRAYGASVLASAGVFSVVAGLAAQTTLGNVFAGLQLVFTDALRIDDVVVVEDEWGRVEELTLTYVVVRLWDERRLVLPATYFTTTPFQNWTRAESRVVGAVELHLDPGVDVPALRRRAHEVIDASPLWDRRDWILQVTGMSELTVVVRVLASAADAPSAWDLRCEVREELLGYLREQQPGALPRLRTQPEPQGADEPDHPIDAGSLSSHKEEAFA